MKVLLNLHHVEQRRSWDCGVSSVAMVLSPADRKYLKENLTEVSKQEEFLNSTWTIDLCYLLARFKVPHHFCTKTLGVHPHYDTQTFYKKALLKDEERVERRFANARESGIDVRQQSIDLAEILQHLQRNLPIIALVNSWQLICKNCYRHLWQYVRVKSVLSKACSYQGHYVVLCGFDSSSEEIFYRNPSRKNKICVCSFESFEESRKCFGTDEDLIFLHDSDQDR